MKILDWYCHQGHQYEFFKTGHDFYLVGVNGKMPDWNKRHRPLNKNVHLIDEKRARKLKFDAVMVRSPISRKRVGFHLDRGAAGIAVIQTTIPYPVDERVRHVVWNSSDVMKKHSSFYNGCENFYIVHGYDPDEFINNYESKNGRGLSLINSFKSRGKILGYKTWSQVSKQVDVDLWGHGNEDHSKQCRHTDSFKELIDLYNKYSFYFNPTVDSAMPRSRAEAAMCGMPIVSTDNYEIGAYFKNKRSAIITNDKDELVAGMKKILSSKDEAEHYSSMARETAIRYFHIDHYLNRWSYVFERI